MITQQGIAKCLLLLTVVSLGLFAQADILDRILAYLANPRLNVLSYEFDLNVAELDAQQIQAKMKLQVISSEDSDSIELHFERRFLSIHSITVNGQLAAHSILSGIPNDPEFALSGDVLSIQGVPIKANELNSVEIAYSITLNTANSGLYLENNKQTLITRNWPYYGGYWFPSNDSPLDSATVSYTLRVPPSLTAIANGKLLRESLDPVSGQKISEWSQSKPTTTYNFVFAVARFSVYKEDICFNWAGLDNARVDCAQAQKKIPLEVYYDNANPEHLKMLSAVKRDVASVVYFSKLFGEYAFEKVGFVFSDYAFNMESTSLIVLRNASAAVHELVHHWWGNNVHIPHWGDFWISEGFTTYVTGLYSEYLSGTNDSCLNDTATDPLNNPESTDPNAIFNSIPYCKGASSLKNLRDSLQILSGNNPQSKQAFLNLLARLYRTYKDKALSTEHFVTFVKANAIAAHAELGITFEASRFQVLPNPHYKATSQRR
jgi:aminopeptidase N